MLILTRRLGERVMIDKGRIQVSVLGIKGNQVRIGVLAPREMAVDREEIFKRKVAEGMVSNAPPIDDLELAARIEATMLRAPPTLDALLRELPSVGVINVDDPRDPRHLEWK